MTKRLSKELAANYATKLRMAAGLNNNEPIHIKSLLLKLGILTRYRPLSENTYGLSLQTADRRLRFMLINSNSTRGRQHFTAAHELYHLYFDPAPMPHVCRKDVQKPASERDADLFASTLLMPAQGIMAEIPVSEMRGAISAGTILRLEQLFAVSHEAMIYRLQSLALLREAEVERFLSFNILKVAHAYGYALSLYNKGNENVTIGDFGANARKLFDMGKISEGHYIELLNQISDGHQ